MIVDVEIAVALGKQLFDPGDLVLVLGNMGLQIAPGMLPAERSRGFQLLARAGWGKPRRDSVQQTPAIVPLRDQRLGVVIAGLRRIEQRGRRVAIHQHLAGGNAHAKLFGFLKKRIDRLRIYRAINARAGDPVAQVFLQENPRDGARKILVRVFQLGRKRIVRQPIQQLLAIGSDHRRLWKMDVAIDEAGGYQ